MWKYLALLILFPAGIAISVISSYFQCGKIGWGESTLQGFFWMIYPAIAFAVVSNVELVRLPFSRTLESFGVSSENSSMVAIMYVMAIISWIGTVWNIHSTEKAVCVATVAEMEEFKKKLLAELQEKQHATALAEAPAAGKA
jgi:hypothetical protein